MIAKKITFYHALTCETRYPIVTRE